MFRQFSALLTAFSVLTGQVSSARAQEPSGIEQAPLFEVEQVSFDGWLAQFKKNLVNVVDFFDDEGNPIGPDEVFKAGVSGTRTINFRSKVQEMLPTSLFYKITINHGSRKVMLGVFESPTSKMITGQTIALSAFLKPMESIQELVIGELEKLNGFRDVLYALDRDERLFAQNYSRVKMAKPSMLADGLVSGMLLAVTIASVVTIQSTTGNSSPGNRLFGGVAIGLVSCVGMYVVFEMFRGRRVFELQEAFRSAQETYETKLANGEDPVSAIAARANGGFQEPTAYTSTDKALLASIISLFAMMAPAMIRPKKFAPLGVASLIAFQGMLVIASRYSSADRNDYEPWRDVQKPVAK